MGNKTRTTAYLFFLASVLSLSAGIGFSRVVAEEPVAKTEQRELLAPDTYEEYLPLVSPADVAVSENYKAFADGNTIYLYNADNGTYSEYTHDVFDDTKNNVTRLQFDKAQNLYFLDASTALYRLDKADLSNISSATAVDTQFVCSTFIIEDDTLFYTNVSRTAQISKVPLDSLDKQSAVLLQDNLVLNPTLAFWDGELYFTNSGQYVHKINPDSDAPVTPTPIAMFPDKLNAMTINSGTFICTDIDGDFYAYDLSALTASKDPNEIPTLTHQENGFSSITSFGEYVYSVCGNSVKRYSVPLQAFDPDYSVGESLNAFNRLNDATETVFVDGILYTSDNGNERVIVYDTVSKTYLSPVATSIVPTRLASDNQTLMLANDTQLTLYSLQAETYGEELFSYTHLADVLTGVTHVYGKYYCATKNNFFFTVEQTQSEETGETVWAIRNATTKTYTHQTEALVSDAYGYLYTLYGTSVYRYTESEFLDLSNKTGTKIVDDLPAGTKRIAVDYERNVYAMTGTRIYVNKRGMSDVSSPETGTDSYAPATEIPLASGDVYTKSGHTPVLTAFAFGIEDNKTYLLYDGNYIVATEELSLPTVKQIPVNGADQQIFSEDTAEFTLLKTNKHALFVEFDVNVLKDAETFPYLSYKRENTEYTVLKLGSTADYHLVALFNPQTHRYNTYLVLKTSCKSISAGDYQTVYGETEQTDAWLTNSVALYKFPYLNPLLTASTLPRGGKVKLLGEIGGLDHEYYQVAYTENNVTKTGFIPKSYALSYNPSAEKSETGEIGKADSNTDAIWRFAYIGLGFGAICILTDFLILRKREDD